MEIRIARDADRRDWDAYVDAHPEGTAFHRSGWARTFVRAFGHRPLHLVAETRGTLLGVLPVVEVDSALTGKRLISTPLAGHGGPLADSAAVAEALVERARSLTRARGAGHLQLHYTPREEDPAGTSGLRGTRLYYGFRERLPEDPDELMYWIPKKTRRMVRLGIKAGLGAAPYALEADDPVPEAGPAEAVLDAAHHLVATTMRNLGTPSYPLSFLRGLLEEDPGRWFLWCARHEGRIVAAVWTARHGDTLYPHFSGADMALRKDGINNFLYHTLMEYGIRHGHTLFDFGRSKHDSGPYHFKRHCGFTPRRLPYRYYLANDARLPDLSPNNPRFQLAIRAWQRLPLSLTKLLGGRLVGHFA